MNAQNTQANKKDEHPTPPEAPMQSQSPTEVELPPTPEPHEQTLQELASTKSSSGEVVQPKSKSHRPDMLSKFLVLEGPTHWLFRLGFASIFLVNAIFAVFEPGSFASVVETNVISSAIGFTDLMVKIAIANDLILAVFIIGGWRKRLVYAWAGAWLILVAGMKLMNLVFS